MFIPTLYVAQPRSHDDVAAFLSSFKPSQDLEHPIHDVMSSILARYPDVALQYVQHRNQSSACNSPCPLFTFLSTADGAKAYLDAVGLSSLSAACSQSCHAAHQAATDESGSEILIGSDSADLTESAVGSEGGPDVGSAIVSDAGSGHRSDRASSSQVGSHSGEDEDRSEAELDPRKGVSENRDATQTALDSRYPRISLRTEADLLQFASVLAQRYISWPAAGKGQEQSSSMTLQQHQ